MTQPRCDLCRFWVQHDPDACDGQCRRFPPFPSTQTVGKFFPDSGPAEVDRPLCVCESPETMDEFWCGEFQPIPKPLPPIVDGQPMPAEYLA
jgi:hypothetical protein